MTFVLRPFCRLGESDFLDFIETHDFILGPRFTDGEAGLSSGRLVSCNCWSRGAFSGLVATDGTLSLGILHLLISLPANGFPFPFW